MDQIEVLADFAAALAAALDARERETGAHSWRVACHTLVLAKRFTSDSDELHQVYWGALLHDIGKIGVPDSILLKNGALTDAEWQAMRRHPEIGHAILSRTPLLSRAAEIVLTHEERFDGSGYPRRLAGNAIPLWSRLEEATLRDMVQRKCEEPPSIGAARTSSVHSAGGRRSGATSLPAEAT